MRFFAAIVFLASATAATWSPETSLKLQTVADVTPSRDGKHVVWTQTRNIIETEKSEQLTHIWLANADGTSRRQLTRGDKSATAPAFSPDGKYILFGSDRSGKRNIYRIPVDGGEAEMLTNWKGAIAAFRMSPDGKRIAFSGSDENPDEEKRKKEKRDFKVIDEDLKLASLWVFDVEGDHKPKKLVSEKYHIAAFTWSPDSKSIAYEHRPTPSFDDARFSDISEVSTETSTITRIATDKVSEAEPEYSPDGRFLAYIKSNGELRGSDIVLFARDTKAARSLRKTFDENPHIAGWTPDSKTVLYSEVKGTRAGLFGMPIDGPYRDLLLPSKGTLMPGIRVNGPYAGITMSKPDEPVEAYLISLPKAQPVKVSAANDDVPRTSLGKTEVIRWKGKDGLDVEGLLTYPVNYETGKKVPMVLVIHGGPAGNFNESFIGTGLYPIAAFAEKGYAVLRANIRGSVGYGQKFRSANFTDWGGGDYQDLMTGVDSVIAKGIADPNRLAVMGWSYGGYMTSWVITQTNRFKCAAIGAGLTNLVSMWGTNDIPSVMDDYFGGAPWDATQAYAKSSPLNFVKNVKTPTLILHGEVDPRVPVSQGYEMYHSLKRLGVETKMVVYPRTEHGPKEPKFVLDILERHLAWVESHL